MREEPAEKINARTRDGLTRRSGTGSVKEVLGEDSKGGVCVQLVMPCIVALRATLWSLSFCQGSRNFLFEIVRISIDLGCQNIRAVLAGE